MGHAAADRRTLAALGPAFWRVAAFGAALSFARISEAFLILKSADAGLAPAWAPAVFVLMNLVYGVVVQDLRDSIQGPKDRDPCQFTSERPD